MIYVVLHYGQVEKVFKTEKDALNYVFDGEDTGNISISDVVVATSGVWEVKACNLE
ncbi:MAG: hypothetical protein IKN43_08705 [Selenomonadaceae bacterium]|nr:hypothetical protein [Selenomonadaceae bacterium]